MSPTIPDPLPRRRLGPLSVPALGLGCMGMSEFYGEADPDEAMATLRRALEIGIDFLDTSDIYGLGHNEELVGRLIAERGRDAVTVATKFGIRRTGAGYERTIDNSPDYARAACEASLRRLGVERIDLYYVHRVEAGRPVEEVMGTLSELVAEGKIAHVGLCEPSPATLRRAHAAHPVAAVQCEWSLWTRDPERNGVLDAVREIGAGFVPYSPLGRGFLTGTVTSNAELGERDFRKANPRFADDAMAANRAIVEAIGDVAREKDCTPAQLALAWVLAQGEDVVPIPGTKRVRWLEDNAAALGVALTEDDRARLDAAIPESAVHGARYTEEGMKGVGV